MEHLIVFYKWVLYLSFSASVLILFALFIRKLLKKKLKLQIQYAIWILILIRLVIPVLPQSSFSIFNVVPIFLNRPPVVSAVDNFQYDQFLTENVDEKATESTQGVKNYPYLGSNIIMGIGMIPISAIKVTFIIWYLGVISGMVYMIGAYILCLKRINKYEIIKR